MGIRVRRVLLVIAGVLTLTEDAAACPICFQGVESPLLDAARTGVLAMALLVAGVLAVFGAWFVRLARLERAGLASTEEPQGTTAPDNLIQDPEHVAPSTSTSTQHARRT